MFQSNDTKGEMKKVLIERQLPNSSKTIFDFTDAKLAVVSTPFKTTIVKKHKTKQNKIYFIFLIFSFFF